MTEYQIIGRIVGAFALAGFLSYFLTPFVKQLAARIGAIDTPKDDRRMHRKPIPRLGGLAIFLGFLCTLLLFGEYSAQMLSVMLGATVIVVLGIFDDMMALGAKFKFIVQIFAAAIPVCMGGLRIEMFTSFNPFSDSTYFGLGVFSIPVTILWIVGITNAVNLIDGLDGLAVGVSSIAAVTMLAVSLLAGQPLIAIIMAALAGACVGFMPYNFNPASIFMGDTGSLALGGLFAAMSIATHTEFLAIILGGLFVIETLSDIIQVGYFKMTHKRVFKMAPIHHHFELCGWTEGKVVVRFWMVELMFVIIGLMIFYTDWVVRSGL